MDLSETRDLLWLAAILYGLAVISGFASTYFTKENFYKKCTLSAIVIGFIFQTRGLYLRGLEIRGCPLGNELERIQFIAWSLILTFLILRLLWKLNLLGSFCSCMAAGLGAVSLSSKEWDQTYWLNPDYGRLFADPWIELHASIAIFSYGIFALLSIVSAMYLIQRKSLLARKVGFSGSFLPPIHDLEQAAHKLLLIGTLFLTLSIIVGGMHWSRNPEFVTTSKLFITLVVWLGYGVLLILRNKNILFGSKFAKVSIALFAAAIISLGFVNSKKENLTKESRTQTVFHL